MFNKLSWKIGLLFLIFILIVELLLFFILYLNLANERVDEVMGDLLARGNTHREVLEANYDASTMEHVGIMESASDFVAVITDSSNNILVASDPVEPEMLEVIEHQDGEEVPIEGKVVEEHWQEERYIATDSPITIDGAHRGHVFMFAPTNNVRVMLDHLSDQFLMIGLLTVILTIITIFILSRQITLPLIKMKKATEQLSKGRNEVVLHAERKDELGELAHSIMVLADDLDTMKKKRNEFLASISHELHTPLTYIQGYADIISRPDTSEKERTEFTRIIREETEQLAVLVKDLFELAKMDENEFVINRERIAMDQLMYSVAERIQPVFDEKQIKFTVHCRKGVIAYVDPERFQQVLLNILDNARHHSPYSGSVCLDVTQGKEGITITVADEGEGIPEEELPYIFDRLYRVEKSRSRKSGGSGLGLSIAKEIVESHGGRMEVESKLGEGTRMTIHLGCEKHEQGTVGG